MSKNQAKMMSECDADSEVTFLRLFMDLGLQLQLQNHEQKKSDKISEVFQLIFRSIPGGGGGSMPREVGQKLSKSVFV